MNEALFRHLSPVPEYTQPTTKGCNVITVIGIDDYHYWPQLDNAVSDAFGVQELFQQLLNFEAPLSPLCNNEATKQAIWSRVLDELHKQLKREDSLLIFFAGHGHTRISQIGRQEVESGYIIPVEAQADRWADYIEIDAFLKEVAKLPPRHILVILDSCRSGIALSDTKQNYRSQGRYEENLSKQRSRKVITSARRGEDAKDSGPIPKHSLFTGILIEGIRSGEIDNDRNGIITSSELGLFLQQRVGQTPDTKQTPDFGSFYYDDRGEMVLYLPKREAAPAAHQIEATRNQEEMYEILMELAKMKQEVATAKYEIAQEVATAKTEMVEATYEAKRMELLLSLQKSEPKSENIELLATSIMSTLNIK